MKRWVVFLLVLLALIVLVSPGVVGRLAEQSLKDSVSWAERGSDEFLVTEEAFDRGWFTTEGRHRLEFRNGDLRSGILNLSGGNAGDDTPAIVVDTRIDHGLVPVSSMSRKAWSLMPGLASTVSTMQLDPGDGKLVPIPGTLYSQVRLTGATVLRYLLEAGSVDGEDRAIEWAGADISMSTDSSRQTLQYDGTIDPMHLQTGDQSFHLGRTTLEGDSRYTGYGFMVGRVALRMASMSMTRHDGGAVTAGNLALDARSDIVDERVNATTTMNVADLSLAGFGDVDVALDVAATGLDARSLHAILTELQQAERTPDKDAALAALYLPIEEDLQAFLSSGAELRINKFDVSLPLGEVAARLRLALPETNAASAFSWPTLILALTASADLRVPVALMELAQVANPQSGALVAMGILKKDGDSYIVNAEYGKGLLTVNGAPLPIPLPGR
jgi:uncharacterized protein YdgA (DUF945 family)